MVVDTIVGLCIVLAKHSECSLHSITYSCVEGGIKVHCSEQVVQLVDYGYDLVNESYTGLGDVLRGSNKHLANIVSTLS